MRFSLKNPQKVFLVSLIVFIFSCIVLLVFPLQTGMSRWKGYRVLIVALSVPEKDITTQLEKEEIFDYISESNSAIENKNTQAPIQPFLSLSNAKRSAWFINNAQKHRYLYLKDTPFLETKAQKAFFPVPYFWKLEKPGNTFTLIPILFSFLLLFCGLITVRNRFYQIVCGLPFLLLTLSFSRPEGYIASLFAIYAIILLADLLDGNGRILTRKQLFHRIRVQKIIIIPLGVSVFAAVSGGLHALLLFSAATCASLSAIPLVRGGKAFLGEPKNKKRLHPVFTAYVMHPLTVEKTWTRRLIFCVSISICSLLLVGILFFNFRTVTSNDQDKDLYIPEPSRYTAHSGFDIDSYMELRALKEDSDLPDLSDFISIQWQLKTFPYQRIQEGFEQPVKGTIAEYSEYTINEDASLSSKTQIMDRFTTDFIRKKLVSESTPLEKMLLEQNRFVTVSVKAAQDAISETGRENILLYFLYLLIPGTAIVMRLKK